MERIQIKAHIKVEGVHRWRKCPIKEVSYLKNYHRHLFHITAVCDVSHNNRDIEFIELGHKLNTFLRKEFFNTQYQCLFFDDMSCEMIGQLLLRRFRLTFIEVTEDGEGGSIIYE